MKAIRAHVGRVGKQTFRVFDRPLWVPVNGILVPVEKAFTVRHDVPNSTFRVELGDEWIELRRKTVLNPGAVIDMHSGLNFGEVLDPKLAPDEINFNVAFSKGVKPTARGWEIINANGWSFGLLLDDWLRKFNPVINNTSVLLSIKKAKEVEGVTAIDLDPSPVDASNYNSWENVYVGWGVDDAWDTPREDNSATDVASDVILSGITDVGAPQYEGSIARTAQRFDLSGEASAVSAASFHVWFLSANPLVPSDVRVLRCTFTDGPADVSAYGKIYDAFGAGSLGLLTGNIGEYSSLDITSAWEKTSTFDIGLATNPYDYLNVQPDIGDFEYIQHDTEHASYIEYTAISSDCSMMMMGV